MSHIPHIPHIPHISHPRKKVAVLDTDILPDTEIINTVENVEGTEAAARRMSATTILDALVALYASKVQSQGEWLLLPELRFWVGLTYSMNVPYSMDRRIDLWAMNLLPSKRVRTAYEIKVSRSDFLQELRHPEKRAPALHVSDQFYFATPPGLVRPGELPEECGLIEVLPCGKARYKVRAPRRKVGLPPWEFVSSVARRTDAIGREMLEWHQRLTVTLGYSLIETVPLMEFLRVHPFLLPLLVQLKEGISIYFGQSEQAQQAQQAQITLSPVYRSGCVNGIVGGIRVVVKYPSSELAISPNPDADLLRFRAEWWEEERSIRARGFIEFACEPLLEAGSPLYE